MNHWENWVVVLIVAFFGGSFGFALWIGEVEPFLLNLEINAHTKSVLWIASGVGIFAFLLGKSIYIRRHSPPFKITPTKYNSETRHFHIPEKRKRTRRVKWTSETIKQRYPNLRI